MNQTTAVNVWKGTNRISLLWEDLLATRVSPDPLIINTLRVEKEASSLDSRGEKKKPAGPGLLEKAGFESLRMLKQTLDILSAPPEESVTDTAWERDTPPGQFVADREVVHDSLPTDPALVLTFIKVSSEPDPQPVSAIDTRRMAYGLKIPMKPLHKRPIHQRLFFCLRQMLAQGSDGPKGNSK